MSDIPKKNQQQVRQRDQDECQNCGGYGTDIHHRKRRREGGHSVANLVLLCRECHSLMHQNPLKAKALGFIVQPWIRDISSIPIRTWTGQWQFNDTLGGYRMHTEKDKDEIKHTH